MKKKLNIIISLIVVICFVWISVYYYLYQKEKQKIDKQIQTQIKNELEDLEVTPVVTLKEESWSLNTESGSLTETGSNDSNDWNAKKSVRDIIEDEKLRIQTFSNIKQCDTLKYMKKSCNDSFLYVLATTNNEISYCDKLQWDVEKRDCLDQINYNKLDCEKIQNSYLKEKCEYNKKEVTKEQNDNKIIESDNNSPDSCKKLSSYADKESCVKKIIISEKNINLCLNVFSKKEEQDSCYKNVSYELNRKIIQEAYDKKDLSLCEKLTTQELKSQCKTMKF